MTFIGQREKPLFSRICGCRKTVNAYTYEARYSDQSPIEVQVDPIIGQYSAKVAAEKYATILGRIPAVWRYRIAIFTISPGKS